MKLLFQYVSVVALVLVGCGGGGGGDEGEQTSPVTKFTVSTQAGEGTTINPTSVIVEKGKTATFMLTLLTGRENLQVTGCGGTLSGNVYTIVSATEDCTIVSSSVASSHTVNFTTAHGVVMDATMQTIVSDAPVIIAAGKWAEFTLVPDHGYDYNILAEGALECVGTHAYERRGNRVFIRPNSSCSYHFKFRGNDANMDGTPDDGQSEYMLHGITATPTAVFLSELKSTDIVVSAYATGMLDELGLCVYAEGYSASNDGEFCRSYIALLDDGVGADKIARDSIYTGILRYVEDALPTADSANVSSGFDGRVLRVMSYTRAKRGGAILDPVNPTSNLGVNILLLDGTKVPVPTQYISGDGITATDHTINIVRRYMSRAYDYSSIARLAARYLDGGYDMYARADDLLPVAEQAGGYYLPLKNDVHGIGQAIFDTTPVWGLPAALQGMVSFPNDPFGITFNHEIGHRWNTYYQNPELEIYSAGGHMPASSVPGIMGGYLLEQRNGEYFVTHSPQPKDPRQFSDFELYTNGMMAPGEMQGTTFCLGYTIEDFNRHILSGEPLPQQCLREILATDIEEVYGKRTPAYDGQVIPLRIANIIPSERPLTDAEFAYYELRAQHFARTDYTEADDADIRDNAGVPFAFACRGRCSLDTRIRIRAVPEWPRIELLP